MPDQTNTDDSRRRQLDEVIGAFLVALDAGQNPSPQEWLACYPELHTELAEFFADRKRMDELVEPLRVSPNTTIDVAFSDSKAADDDGTSAPLPKGTRVRYFGDYELQKVLGEGGMGIVYKARQMSLNRAVALKMIRAARFPSADEVHRFQNEAEAVARLDHPNIVPIFEVGRFEDQHYFSMKLIAGTSLDKRLNDYAADPRRAARLVAAVAEAIHHAHQRGILHRDLKPANILVDADGHPHVTDFGLAKRVEGDSELTRSGAIVGTPAYMAPEQASAKKGTVTTGTDVHGLGAILYALSTSRAPFGGTTVLDTLEQVRERPPDPPRKLNPRVPRDLEVICLKCLEKDPRRRYASADAIAEDLKRWLAGEPIAARPVGNAARVWMWCRRNPVVVGAAGLVAAAMVVVAVLALLYADRQTRLASSESLRADEQTSHGREQAKAAAGLKVALSQSNRRLAMLNFERAQRAFDSGQVNVGLLYIVETLRYALEADDRAWQQLARTNLSFWRYHCPELKGVFSHHAPVFSVAFSPDGKTILTGSQDNTVRLWDAVTTLPIAKPIFLRDQRREHQNAVEYAVLSPNGKTIFTTNDDTAWLWDTASGLPIGGPMAHKEVVLGMYSPDANTVLTVSLDRTGRLWDAATALPIGQPLVHRDFISTFAFRPDGKTILTGSQDKTVRLWDASTGLPIGKPMVCQGEIRPVAFSPDGKAVLTEREDKTVRLWDIATGRPIGAPMQHQSSIGVVKFSPDGKTILITSGSDSNMARLWDAATGRPIGDPLVHQGRVGAVAFSPDGKTVLTRSRDDTARLWDAATGRPIGRPLVHRGMVRHLAFSPDGKTILTGSANEALLWDATTAVPLGQPLQHLGSISSVSYSLDGKTILTTGRGVGLYTPGRGSSIAYSPDGKTSLTVNSSVDPYARLWDAVTGLPIGEPMVHQENVADTAFSPDGKTILTLSTNATARLWNAATGRSVLQPMRLGNTATGRPGLESMSEEVRLKTFIPDGKTVLTKIPDSPTWQTNLTTGRRRVRQSPVASVAYSHGGRIILTTLHDNTFRLWDPATGQPVGQPMVHERAISFAAYSPDGKTILTGSTDNKARLWDTVTGLPIGQTLEHGGPVTSVAFSPDGKTVLTGSADNNARLWDTVTGQPIGQPLENEGPVTSVAFSPDGRTFVTAIRDATLRLWDAATGQPIGQPMVDDVAVSFLAYSPDGKTIVALSGDNSLRLWSATSAQPIGQPMVHHKRVTLAAYSPDGKTIITGTWDNKARLWHVGTAQPIGPPLEHEGSVYNAAFMLGAFSPDGKTVVTVRKENSPESLNSTARLWHLPAVAYEEFPLIKTWVETIAGLEVDDHGNIHPLDHVACRERRERLRQLGGPPKTDSNWLFDSILYGPDPTARARAWIARKQFAEAEAAFAEAVHAQPSSSFVWTERGRFYVTRSELEKAAADFAQALVLGDRDPKLLGYVLANDTIFDRVVVQAPGDAAERLWPARGYDRAKKQCWAEAAAAYHKAVLLRPENLTFRSRQILSLMIAGDREGLHRACSELLDRFSKTTDSDTANNVVWTCVLAPGAAAYQETLVQLAELAVKGYTVFQKPFALNTLGAALYRAGRLEDAIHRLDEGIRLRNGEELPADWVFLAMSHSRLGHRNEARRWLDRFRIRQPSADPIRVSNELKLFQFWNELEIRLLRSEAEALVLYDPVFPADPFAR